MKRLIHLIPALVVVWAVVQCGPPLRAQFFGRGLQQSVVITIRADGSCDVENKSIMPRALAVQQMQMMERAQQAQDGLGDNAENAATNKSQATNALTDDQLKEKFAEVMGDQLGEMSGGADKEPDISVDKDHVTATIKSAYTSIHDMLADSAMMSGMLEDSFDSIRFEQDTNSHIVVTLTPGADQKRELKQMRAMLKMTGVHEEVTFVFPGKVLSSSFPETQTNATWIVVDATKDDSIDALAKLFDGPDVITAEAAGLTLKEPLDSKSLVRIGPKPTGIGSDLPITDGATGFVAQAEGIVTATLHVFPEGSNYFKQGNPFGAEAGTTVHVKLFPPKGRTLQSLDDVKVVKATDDKGRDVPKTENGAGDDNSMEDIVDNNMGQPGQNDGAELELRLALPQPDAQAIDEITGEAIAVTAGGWKELVVSNLTESSTNEYDLAEVLPGAKLSITKFSTKNNMVSLRVQLKGPATVANLKLKTQFSGVAEREFDSSMDESSKTKGAETTRTVRISAPSFNDNGAKATGPFNLIIRYPQDLRRERVTFKLKGLDLL